MAAKTQQRAGEQAWLKASKVVSRERTAKRDLGRRRGSGATHKDGRRHLTGVAYVSCVNSVQNAELFSLTYGAMVMQLIEDYEDVVSVNAQLEKM